MAKRARHGKQSSISNKEAFFIGAIAVCFLSVATHGLTSSSLWFDEGVEYWYSKYLFGPIPFNGDAAFNTQNMYERIVTTFQPPLYNVLMYFWLLINESVWWLRFFGVLMGLASLFGVYATIRLVSDYRWATAGAVLFTFNYHLCYYWQEFAEYCLMLAFISWLCYWFTKALLTKEFKSVVMFVVFCICAIYTHYGAALLAIPLGLVLVIFFAVEKQHSLALRSLLLFIAAAIVTGLPLYWFFLRVQLNNGNTNVMHSSLSASLSTIGVIDFLKNWIVVVKGLFFIDFERPCALLLALVFTVFILVAPIMSSDRALRALGIACLFSYTFFYLAVRSGYYSYGTFLGGWNNLRVRYAIFFTPLLIIVATIGAHHLIEMLRNRPSESLPVRDFATGVLCCAVTCYAVIGWTDSISRNWIKSDSEELVRTWYELSDGETPIFVYYGADALFSYYVTQDPRYNDVVASNVAYQDWMGGKSEDELEDSIDACLAKLGTRPDRFYLAACHWTSDLDYTLSYLESCGYSVSPQYEGDLSVVYELTSQNADS